MFYLFSVDKLPPGFPIITQSPSSNKVVEIGHNTVLKCEATGNPQPKITWLKNMLPINVSLPRSRYSVRDDMPGKYHQFIYPFFLLYWVSKGIVKALLLSAKIYR